MAARLFDPEDHDAPLSSVGLWAVFVHLMPRQLSPRTSSSNPVPWKSNFGPMRCRCHVQTHALPASALGILRQALVDPDGQPQPGELDCEGTLVVLAFEDNTMATQFECLEERARHA